MKRALVALTAIATFLVACVYMDSIDYTPPTGGYLCNRHEKFSTAIFDPHGILDSSTICSAGNTWQANDMRFWAILTDPAETKDWEPILVAIESPLRYSTRGRDFNVTNYVGLAATTDGKLITVHQATNGTVPSDIQEKMKAAVREGLKNGQPTQGFVDAAQLAAPRIFQPKPTPTIKLTPTPTPSRTPTVTPTPTPTPDPAKKQFYDQLRATSTILIALAFLAFMFGEGIYNMIRKPFVTRASRREANRRFTSLQTKLANMLKALENFFDNPDIYNLVQSNSRALDSWKLAREKNDACRGLFERLETKVDQDSGGRIDKATMCLLGILGQKHSYMTAEEFKRFLDLQSPVVLETTDPWVEELHQAAQESSGSTRQLKDKGPVLGVLDHIIDMRQALAPTTK